MRVVAVQMVQQILQQVQHLRTLYLLNSFCMGSADTLQAALATFVDIWQQDEVDTASSFSVSSLFLSLMEWHTNKLTG